MLCKKWIECWGVWFVRDSGVVVLHWFKNIPFHSVTHFIYLIMAVMGYLKWRKIMAAQK
jgi:nicotinamide mononucleotide transporter